MDKNHRLQATRQDSNCQSEKAKVVIVGGGFGGLEAAKRLRKKTLHVTLIDRNNYHLFQPLLYQVGTGGLSPANISTPLRAILGRQQNCHVALGEVTDIDLQGNRVILGEEQIAFDYLIVAAGANNNFFGNDQWQQYATGLKSLEDALRMRRQIFSAYEAAEREQDPVKRRALMTFVVVGGGPTGVELAGAISEIARHTLKHDFRRIDPSESKIILLEAGAAILGQYPERLSKKAVRDLHKLGVDVQTGTKVTNISDAGISTESDDGKDFISAQTVLWAAGVAANPLAKTLADRADVEIDSSGRLPVTQNLNIPGVENVYVIGDMAASRDESGSLLPGVAPVAIQQGKYVANLISQKLSGKPYEDAFRYRDLGSMATIGRAKAIAKIGRYEFSGFFAWILWLVIHLIQIIQVPNRLLILIQWAWNYLTFNRSARIITGPERQTCVKTPAPTSAESTTLPAIKKHVELERDVPLVA